MPSVGFETHFHKKVDTVFIVKNITKGTKNEKTVRLFTYPIPPGKERDLLAIPFVSEADIRHSLLKGDLRVKAEGNEIKVVRSNIDLLQFDDEQLSFLTNLGVVEGTQVTGTGGAVLNFAFKQNIELVGTKDGSNRVFTTPDNFINGTFGDNVFRILITHNGVKQVQGIDYAISESGGSGTGFDTITFVSFIPTDNSQLFADYVVET